MKYAISGGHEVTVEVAELILQNGGNAFDAAIAAYLASFVAEPCMASAGAGGLAMLRTRDGKQKCLDFFCQTPIHKKLPTDKSFYPVDIDFGETSERFYIGIGSSATPGAIAGIFHLHRHYATMPLMELASPAIKIAKEGLKLNAFQAFDFHLLRDIMGATPGAREVFYNGDVEKREGDDVIMPHFADFLENLCREGEGLFYKGEIARSIAQICHDEGGNLTMQDFEQYRAIERDPFVYKMKDGYCATAPFPSIGGSILLSFLNQIENDRDAGLSGVINAYKHTLPLTTDLDALQKEVKSLIENNVSFQGPKKHNGTSHFNILDKEGNAISLSTTVGEGCGVMIPGTDMQMNNMLGEMALLPNGLHSWEANKRLISMMSPTLLSDKNNDLRAVLGTGGAGRIPFMIGQVIHKLIRGIPYEKAVSSPRIHINENTIHLEPGIDLPLSSDFDLKQWEKQSLYFGGVHSVFIDGEDLHAYGDQRRHGYGVVG